MSRVKSWREGAAGQPPFPADFQVIKKAVLQVTDIKTNRNKYYAIELHQAGAQYRVYTHYGRTDDLETNPSAGTRESRYFADASSAEANYAQIYQQKTSTRKGYKEVSLASSRIGSVKAQGQSSGHVDAQTLAKMEGQGDRAEGKKPVVVKSSLPSAVQEIVRYLYNEATEALTSTVAARITANGIETPLGVLTIGQVEKGEAILEQLYKLFSRSKGKITASIHSQMVDLSGEFYTVVPHRIGRSRAAAQQSVIDTLAEFNQKQETLQLMKDMLSVNGDSGEKVLFDDDVDSKYLALGCSIDPLERKSAKFAELEAMIEGSQVKTKHVKVKNIWQLRRAVEHEGFREDLDNHQLLFHGSRPKNWVGILSRGILLPKIVVSMGVDRTDAGWLGNGIYFGNAVCTTLYYAHPGKRETRFMSVARVALGKVKQYRKITYGLQAPPTGYDSCHGVRAQKGVSSEFEDDEFVVYETNQQKLEFLVEYSG